MGHPVLLYDGVCGLCNRAVRFVLRHDREKLFRFASLQSSFAARVLAHQRVDPTDLSTAYMIVFHAEGEVLLERSAAVLYVMQHLAGIWPNVAQIAGLLPHWLRDWMYGVVARNRYQVFGKYQSCPLPGEAERDRFIEV